MKTSTVRLIASVLLPVFFSNVFAAHIAVSRLRSGSADKSDAREVSFTLSDYDEPFDVHKKAQAEYLAESTHVMPSPKYQGKSEVSRPNPARISWTVESSDGLGFDEYTVLVGTSADMSGAKAYVADTESLKIYNPLLGETYYWTVSVTADGETYTSSVASFEIADVPPRNLDIQGVTNARDLGGWMTADGGRVKQGMLFRTAMLHSDDQVNIKDDGIEAMRELGLKSEIDLRSDVTKDLYSVLGNDVAYYNIPMDFSDEIMDAEREGIRRFFEIISDESNYPIVFHCAIGTDRTGVCAFLVNGLLGVSVEDLYRDYRFSNFGMIASERDGRNIAQYIDFLREYDGEALAERIRSYLIGIGVTAEQLDSVIDIMTEKD